MNKILSAFLAAHFFLASPGELRAAPKLYWFIPDGARAEPRVLDVFRFAREGKYPNIRKMMKNGSYGYSIPTYPSHTPANFATLVTGAYPETHGVADGPMRVEGYPLAKPSIMGFSSTAKKVPPAWKIFEDNGKSVAVISVPGSTPPEMNSGITARGRWGSWGTDFFAVNFEAAPGAVPKQGRGSARLFYAGQELTRFPEPVKALGWTEVPRSFSEPLEIAMLSYGATVYAHVYDETDDGAKNYSGVVFSLDKKTPLAVLKQNNEWSGWKEITLHWGDDEFPVKFKICLIKLEASGFLKVRLLFDTMNSTTIYPPELAEEIGRMVGPMVDFPDNWPAQLNNYPEEKNTFLSEMRLALDWHRRLVPYLLQKQKLDVVIQDTYVPNQMLESRWWLPNIDDKSDRYKKTSAADKKSAWADIHEMYRGLDAILGEAIKNAGPDTLIVLSSDHGVIPLNRYVLLNNLFAREGLLKFTMDEKTGEPVVDWANTRAIHLKMHGVYINPGGLSGKWKRGAGPEYERLRKRVRDMLAGLSDNGVCPFDDIVAREEAQKLRLPRDRVADLILVMRPGYGLNEELGGDMEFFRDSVEGGYKQALFADNNQGLWTPFIIMGPGVKKGYRIKSPVKNADQLPTLLRLTGTPVPGFVQGKVVDEIFDK